MRRSWLIRVGDSLSQLFNVVVLNGEPDESTSGRSYREGWALQEVIDWVFSPYESDHCRKAYELDLERAKARVEGALRWQP